MPTQELKNLQEMQAFARKFVDEHPQRGVFGLQGDLGVGKTSFVRAVVGILCERAQLPDPRVISPSFVLHQRYPVGVDHFDLYRLEKADEATLQELGFFETLERGGWVFIEWPERLGVMAPKKNLRFEFTETGRLVTSP